MFCYSDKKQVAKKWRISWMDNKSEYEQHKSDHNNDSSTKNYLSTIDNETKLKSISEDLIKSILKFRDERDWKQFHNAKDIAISICLEAAELLELFQWSGNDLDVTNNKKKMCEELADILIYSIYMVDVLDADIGEIIKNKININENKYIKSLAHGRANKYNTLEKTDDNLPK